MWPDGMNMDFAMFSPWELITTMDEMKLSDPAMAEQIGKGLDAMGYDRKTITQLAATGAPMPPPMGMGMSEFSGPEMGGYGGQATGSPHMPYPPVPPVPQAGVAPRPAPGGMGEAMPPDMTSAAPSFTPPASLGGLTYPSQAPAIPGGPAAAAPQGPVQGPPAPAAVDPRTQALRAMAANQGIKAPKEPQSERPDIRQAPPPPKQADVQKGSTALAMLLQAALSGGGGPQNPLRVPTLGALVGRR